MSTRRGRRESARAASSGPPVLRHQRAGVGEHDRIVVGVDHAGVRLHLLHDLVQVRPGRDSGADVQELVDPALGGQETPCAVHELAVGAHVHRERGPDLLGGLRGGAVERFNPPRDESAHDRFDVSLDPGDLAGEEQIGPRLRLPGLPQHRRSVEVGVAVHHAEPHELGAFQPAAVPDQQLDRSLGRIQALGAGAQRRCEVLETGSESGSRSTASAIPTYSASLARSLRGAWSSGGCGPGWSRTDVSPQPRRELLKEV